MTDKRKEYVVTEGEAGERLDKFLSIKNWDLSRSYLKKLINDRYVTVNNFFPKPSYCLKPDDQIILSIPEAKEADLKPEEIKLNIIYEDNDIIVVNKQPGLIVHPVPGNRTHTLVNALLAYTDNLSGINGIKRPGIVHRLDKNTSGALVVARNDKSHHFLVEQFKKREVKKIYHAIVKGNIVHEKGTIEAPIGRNQNNRKKMAVTDKNSKNAVTHFSVLERFGDYTYVKVKLDTGRTHQIRVHFSYMGHPILGDEKYGKRKKSAKRQMLHAYILGLSHPNTGKWMEFKAPLPADFKSVLAGIRSV
ncbi:MAG: RluA family pseudouridine synthase [Halanaerobiaceae bacterium]